MKELVQVKNKDSELGKRGNTTEDYFKNVHKIPEMLGIDKKTLGAYYTDESIVNYMIDRVDISADSNILDPSCGCGSFILPLQQRLLKMKPESMNGLYGVDIDKKAIDYTINFLTRVTGIPKQEILSDHILEGDFIFTSITLEGRDTSWEQKISKVLSGGGFDIIIGNPPFNIEEATKKRPILALSEHQVLANETRSVPIYFMLKAFELLRNEGILAFVLPKTLLYVGRYYDFRRYILDNFTILGITEIGLKFKGVRGEQIILFIKRSRPNVESKIEFSTINGTHLDLKANTFKISQSYFRDSRTIPTMPNKGLYEIVRKLSRESVPITEFTNVDICRGVSLGKSHVKSIPFVNNNFSSANGYIRGKDISKFRLRSISVPEPDIYTTSELTRLRVPKIVLQNIFSSESGLISYLDFYGFATTETVTNIIISDKKKLSYIYGVMNSKLLNFYLSEVVFSGSKLTMHMDNFYIKQLPFIWRENAEETSKIIKIAENSSPKDIPDAKKTLARIDEYVYDLYGITFEEREIIERVMAKTLSHKSLW